MKTSVAPPGILGGEPRSPSAGAKGLRTEREVRARLSEAAQAQRHYSQPKSLGMTSLRFSPTHMSCKPLSQPLITYVAKERGEEKGAHHQ